MPDKGHYNDDRNWHTKQPKQNAATHVSPLSMELNSLLNEHDAPQCGSQIIARNEKADTTLCFANNAGGKLGESV